MAHTKVTKTYSQNTGAANTFSYSGSFDVFKATEVEVELDNVKLTYTASTINDSALSPREYSVDTSAKTVHIGGADLSSGTVVIQPVTDMGAPTPRADYAPGSSITSEDLNNNQLQLMRKAMEYDEQKLSSRGGTMTGNLNLAEDITIIFEGATDDGYETTLTVADPTADRTITLPNITGTVVTTGDTGTVTAAMLAADSVDSSELVDGSIDTSHISSGAVTTAKLAADVVTGAKIADDAINSEHYADGSIDTAHIADANVTTAKIADDAITTAKIADDSISNAKMKNNAITAAEIADDVINSRHYVAGSIDTEHIADSQVTTAKIAADNITSALIADDQIDSEHYVDGSIDTAHIGDNQVTTAKIADANITTAKLATDAVTTVKITDANVTTAKIADSNITTAKIADDSVTVNKLASNSVNTGKIVDGNITTAKLAADAVTSGKLADDAVVNANLTSDCVTSDNLADNSVTTVQITDANVTTAKITDANVTTAKIANDAITIGKLGCEQTTISDSDSHIPTSGAVVDYVAAQIAPIGGLEVIADEDNFPTTQPAAGVVISIADAGGVVFNGSGVSTTARTAGNGSDNVTINNAPSSLYSETLAAGVGMQVSSTGSSHTYNYHKILAKEADVKQLSDDINDFNSRYRINAGEPSSNNDDGDLVWDTNANKMKVYDATASAWTEVTSTGDFKFLVPVDAGTTTAATWDGSDTSFDLKETTNSGSAASVSNINQLIVSLNGVIQKPNTGSYDASEEGFYLTDSDTIRFCTAPPSGSTAFILQIGSAVSIPTPGDGTVTTAKIASAAVTTAKIAKPLDFADNEKARFGTGNDLEIFHDGSNSYIKDVGTGILQLNTNYLQVKNADDNETILTASQNGAIGLYYDNSKKFETSSSGVKMPDSAQFELGDGSDLKMWHSGSHSFIRNETGNLTIEANGAGDDAIKIVPDGAVELYHDNSKKFETTSGGATVTGNLTATSNLLLADSVKARFGTDEDLQIYHNGSHGYITEGTGNLKISVAGGSNQIQLLKGSSENIAAFIADGSCDLYYDNVKKLATYGDGVTVKGDLWLDNQVNTGKDIWFDESADTLRAYDDVKFTCGDGDDLKIYHNGSQSKISHNGAGDLEIETLGAGENILIDASEHVLIRTNGSEDAVYCTKNGSVGLYYDDVKKFETSSAGVAVTGQQTITHDASQVYGIIINNTNATGTIQQFKSNGTVVGSIGISASATTYYTSSDYRLKENEVTISDGITRLKTLKPYRFNFKAEPSKTVDGFFAHEVTAVPEAITGEKDGTEMQQIDQSKLVPLLTAALQEAITKIETLETKVAALEAK